LKVLFRDYRKPLLQVFVAALISSVGSTFTVFALSYATSTTLMLWLAIIANVVATVIIPVYAAISDRIGRKPVFLAGTIGCAVTIVLFLWAISTGGGTLILILGVLLGGFVYSLTNAVWPATYAERFPTTVRLSGIAIGTQFGFAVGGFAPLAAAALAGAGGTPAWLLPAGYAVLMCVLATISVASMKDNYDVHVNDIGVLDEKAAA
jgi:MFS family permease